MLPSTSAGRPPIRTVGMPGPTIGVGGCTAGGGNEQVCRSPMTEAGMPPMSTVGTPGPVITPGWPVMSLTRAAGGICGFSDLSWSLVDLDHGAADGGHRATGHFGLRGAGELDAGGAGLGGGLAGDLDVDALELEVGLRVERDLHAGHRDVAAVGLDRDVLLGGDLHRALGDDLDRRLRLLHEADPLLAVVGAHVELLAVGPLEE